MMTPAQLATLTDAERAMVDAAMAAIPITFGENMLFDDGYAPEAVRFIVAAQPANVLRTFAALADARIERDRLREALEYIRHAGASGFDRDENMRWIREQCDAALAGGSK